MLREIVKAFPQADVLYLGDHARAPYGDRDSEEIRRFTKEAVDWLFTQGCDEILFACNTASSVVLPKLNDARVFGIVEPTREWLASRRDRYVGLLATNATVDSGAYTDAVAVEQACPAWSILIERGDARSDEAKAVVKEDVDRLFVTDSTIDTIVLACTHYPIFHAYVEQALGNHLDGRREERSVQVVDQGQMLVDWMRASGRELVTTTAGVRFCTTGDPERVASTAEQAFGVPVRFEKVTL